MPSSGRGRPRLRGERTGKISATDAKSYKAIDLAYDGAIATITLDREERLNAFTLAMAEEIMDALDRTDADPDVRCVIVTGRGRAFCAGADLAAGTAAFDRGRERFNMTDHADRGGTLTRRIFDSAKPIIAAINGPAVGIGITMTLAMDIRLVADSAKIGFVFVRRGIAPEATSTFLLPRLVGISKACEWVFTGRIFDAQEALDAGLARSVHPAEELLPAARELAREMSDGTSAVAVALSRRMLWQMLAEGNPGLAHEVESEAFHYLGSSPDAKEGVASFLEKRDAAYPLRVGADLPEFFHRWAAERGGLEPAAAEERAGDRRLRLADRPNGG